MKLRLLFRMRGNGRVGSSVVGLNTGTMQGWVYKRTHRGAIERARREGKAPEAPGEDPSALEESDESVVAG